jgi:hypothetical protein
MSRELPEGIQTHIEYVGLNSILFTVQNHLEYPLFIDRVPAVNSLYKQYSSDYKENGNVLYIRSHSKSYRPNKDGANNLLVRLQVFKESEGISLVEVLTPLVPEPIVIKWIPRLMDLAEYLIPRYPLLNRLTTPEILAKFLLFWLSEVLIQYPPEELKFDLVEIFNIRKPLWGDPEGVVILTFSYPPTKWNNTDDPLTRSTVKDPFFCSRLVTIPFFQTS